MKKTLLYLLVLGTFWACTERFTFPGFEVQPEQMVINCIITPDSLFSCELTHTYQLNDTTDHAITDAAISIYNNATQTLICQLNHQHGAYYCGDQYPEIGVEYRIHVQTAQYGEATATTIIPEPQQASNVHASVGTVEIGEYESCSKLDFSIINSPTTETYYQGFLSMFEYIQCDEISDPDLYKLYGDSILNFRTIESYNHSELTTDVVLMAEELNTWDMPLLFSNAMFLDESHQFTVYLDDLYSSYGAVFILQTLSAELYQYRKSFYQHIIGRSQGETAGDYDLVLGNYIQTPTAIYSNFDGALGIFGGYVHSTLYTDELIYNQNIPFDLTEAPYHD